MAQTLDWESDALGRGVRWKTIGSVRPDLHRRTMLTLTVEEPSPSWAGGHR